MAPDEERNEMEAPETEAPEAAEATPEVVEVEPSAPADEAVAEPAPEEAAA